MTLPLVPAMLLMLCLILGLAVSGHAVAGNPDAGPEDIAPYASYRIDTERRLEIDQVASSQNEMTPLPEGELSNGYTRNAFWFRIRPPQGEWLLEVASPFLDHVDLYLPQAGGGYTVIRSGDARPFAEREIAHRHPLFRLPAALAGPAYLHVYSEGLINIPLRLWQPDAFASHVAYEEFGFGVYYEIMLVMVLYNLSLYLFVRDRNYLYYVLYIGSYILFLGHADGDSALIVAERLGHAIAGIGLKDFPDLRLSASFGVAWPGRHEHEDVAETLIRRADQALYLAKHLGRNRVCTQLDVKHRLEQEAVV